MGIKIHKIFIVLFFLSSTIGFSQKQDKQLAKANEKYDELAFIKAGKMYEKLIEKGNTSKEVYARLGDTYFFNSDYANAAKWYTKLMEDGKGYSPEYYYRYSISLRASDQADEAFTVMSNYYNKAGKSEDAKKWNPKEYLKAIKDQADRYNGIDQSGVNTAVSDFGIAFIPNEEAIKQAAEIAKFEKAEKARIIRENAAKRRKDDNNKLATKSETQALDKTAKKAESKTGIKAEEKTEDTEAKNFNKLPKYKEVIYATAKDSGFFIKRKNNWNEKPFLKLYTAQIGDDGKLVSEKKMGGEINAKFHQSTPVLTKDGLTMYFTRSVENTNKLNTNPNVQSKKADKIAAPQLKIFQAQKVNGKWTNIQELPYPINMEGTSSAHPALNPENDELYFASNRQKKLTDTDLYVVSRKKGGGFANRVESLGEEINTYGRETFPFVDDNGILYFSSDGHPGLGGLDVFAAAKNSEGKYVVVNVGDQINSINDDFAYAIDSDSKNGYFSSNRQGGTGDDDIYKFTEIKPIVFPFNVNPEIFGTVKDSVSGETLRDVDVIVYNDVNQVIKTVHTDEAGKYSVEVPPLKKHTLEFKKKGYTTETAFVDGLKISEKKEVPVNLFNELAVIVDNKVVTLKEGDNLTDKLKLSPIYFDYGGYTLRKSSKVELDKVISLMKTRPSISIEVKSHTDSRGKDDYNLRLSKNRAKTTMDYIIIEGGIAKDRVWGDGYGETQLINKCANDVPCTEAEHELNRRSDFIMYIKEQN